MSMEYSGNQLWNENRLKYTCGCTLIAGKTSCPIHQKPMKEQMILGTDAANTLNEVDRYEKERLNE